MEISLKRYLKKRFSNEIDYNRNWLGIGIGLGLIPLGIVCYMSASIDFLFGVSSLALPVVVIVTHFMITYYKKHSSLWYLPITSWFIFILLSPLGMKLGFFGGIVVMIIIRSAKSSIEKSGRDYDFFQTLTLGSVVLAFYSAVMLFVRNHYGFDGTDYIIIIPYLLTMVWGGLALYAYTVSGQRLVEKIRGFQIYLRTVEQLPARMDQRDAVMEVNAPSLAYLIALDLNPYWSNRLLDAIIQLRAYQVSPNWKII